MTRVPLPSPPSRRGKRAGGIGLLLLLLSACNQPPIGPPRGGEHLLPAAESAARVLIGRIDDLTAVDLHGYAASLRPERQLLPAAEPPSAVNIAWEELARSRPPRFKDGDRVLVALVPLPNASLWDQRFPGARADGSVVAVADSGRAYMHDADDVSIELLATYLRLPPEQRDAGAGLEALSRIVARAAPGLAQSGLRRLDTMSGLGQVDAAPLQPLVQAAGDEGRPPALRQAIVDLIGRHAIASLRPQLDELAAPGSIVRAQALQAMAAIDGGLPAAVVVELLASADVTVRALGARYATTPELSERLGALIREDAAPAVRAAAATALVGVRGIDSFDTVAPALADGEPTVRLAAVQALGNLGDAAVAPLTGLAEKGSLAEATGAILALDQCGATGRPALIKLAGDHPDERVRNVALLALGKLGHGH